MKRDGSPVSPPEVTTNYYTALGSLQDVYYPNGVHGLYQYDLMNRLTNLVYTTGTSQLLAQYTYGSTNNGQWRTAIEIQRQIDATLVTNLVAWAYDDLGRVTNEVCSSSLTAMSYTNVYVYSLVGNLVSKTNVTIAGISTAAYTYNDNDQLLLEIADSGTFTNSYDINGALTNHSSASEQNIYSYNLQNKLTSAVINRSDSGSQLAETINYVYDYNGRRVQAQWVQSVNGGGTVSGTNYFLNDTTSPSGVYQVLEESPSVGSTPSISYTLGGFVTSQSSDGVIRHLLRDGHGSTRVLTDSSGNVAADYNFDAYGNAVNFATGLLTPPATKVLYSGGEFDPHFQQYNLRVDTTILLYPDSHKLIPFQRTNKAESTCTRIAPVTQLINSIPPDCTSWTCTGG